MSEKKQVRLTPRCVGLAGISGAPHFDAQPNFNTAYTMDHCTKHMAYIQHSRLFMFRGGGVPPYSVIADRTDVAPFYTKMQDKRCSLSCIVLNRTLKKQRNITRCH